MIESERRSLAQFLKIIGGCAFLLGAGLVCMTYLELRDFNMTVQEGAHRAILTSKRYEYIKKPRGKYAPYNRYFFEFTFHENKGYPHYATKGWVGLEKDIYDKYHEGAQVVIYVSKDGQAVIDAEKNSDRSFLKGNLRLAFAIFILGVFSLSAGCMISRADKVLGMRIRSH
jgi:hypothetical protein